MQSDQPSDSELVGRVLAGNREAFGCLYDRYARLVRAVLFGATRDWNSVPDLTQECFLRAYQKLAGLRQADRFGAWVVGIARQIARERKRALRRNRHQFLGGELLEIQTGRISSDVVDAADETDVVLGRLAELPERERLAIHAFFLSGSSAQQAAELLELSRSGLYALLQRALSRLASRMDARGAARETK